MNTMTEKLSVEEYRALELAREWLLDGARYAPSDELFPVDGPRGNEKLFNMNFYHAEHPCGTAYCIGGAARELGGVQLHVSYARPGLHDLCNPNEDIIDWNKITPNIAARAVTNYLDRGDADWAGLAREYGVCHTMP